MRSPQVINNISVDFKNDEKAKEKFVNYIVNFIIENEFLEEGGAIENHYE